MRYVWAVTLVALGLLVGFVLQPGFGRSQAYATFYPVVFVAALVLGPRPAALTTILSAAVAYWCFIPPAFQWKWDLQVGSALAFFLGTTAVAIYLISRLRQALAVPRGRRPSAAELSRVNAVIFADLAARKPSAGAPIFAAPSQRPIPTPACGSDHPSPRSFKSVRLDLDAASNEAGAQKNSPRNTDSAVGQQPPTLH